MGFFITCCSKMIISRTLPSYAGFVVALFLIAPSAGFLPHSHCGLVAQPTTLDVRPAPEIREIRFNGNVAFGEAALKDVLLSKESPSSFSKFLFHVFGEKLGSKAEYYDAVAFDGDIRRLSEFYQENGFYNAQITAAHARDSSDNVELLTFSIRENRRSLIDTIDYRGLDQLSPEARTSLLENPAIRRGSPYVKSVALLEISRVLEYLSNNGFPNARFDPEKSIARRYLSTNNFYLELAFVTGVRCRFGDITLNVDPPREDITPNIVLRQLDFQKGDLYSRDKKSSSERNINRMGLFESARIEQEVPAESTAATVVPIEVTVRPRPRNELSPELVVSDENNAFNLGVGLGYTNRNFFGDGRSFTAHTRARTQDIQRWDFGQVFGGAGFRDPSVVGAVDVQVEILQPYLFTRTLTGSLTASVSAEKQAHYILSILRSKLGLSNRFATYTYGLLEWTLERVSPEFLDSSGAGLLAKTLEQKQFNSILTLTLQRDKTNDIFSPTDGFFNSISLEESGVLPKLFPGIRAGLPFTQYYKVTLSGRWYKDLTQTRYDILAVKLKTGYQDKYGESRKSDVSIPLNRRFFSGGSGSVRGWNARELGAMRDEDLQFGGNFIVDGSLEMRINYLRGFGKLGFLRLDNIWGVYFLDFGNVWSNLSDFKSRDIAMAAGVGFRYETFFGPFRIDYGFRLYDPKAAMGRQSVFKKRFIAETLGNGVLHFGLGHAF
jgi:outer membrane protein insertion porin family